MSDSKRFYEILSDLKPKIDIEMVCIGRKIICKDYVYHIRKKDKQKESYVYHDYTQEIELLKNDFNLNDEDVDKIFELVDLYERRFG